MFDVFFLFAEWKGRDSASDILIVWLIVLHRKLPVTWHLHYNNYNENCYANVAKEHTVKPVLISCFLLHHFVSQLN